MALTEEMQIQIDFQTELENLRNKAAEASSLKQQKLEAVRTAQNIIFENRRVKLASEVTDITPSQVIALAEDLLSFINS